MVSKQQPDYKKLSQRLDEIVVKMQDDATSIDESLELYEEGIRLTSEIEDYLKQAENKLKKISARFKES